ncbi:hypothetical protein SeLEV6574_g07828 [Synchytrium endobioticum]|uniref:RING-type E3 ubiquitin transferase n=1 Tax=Synchytrium endobioticum TaxID=286115 RepID=A0A507CIG5_9FUNG|nr:hypothetical protein SeLEV6574_g07828 [Synchytrium endobioticum]
MALSRLTLYGMLSTTSALAVILRAIVLRNAQFYSTCIHLTSSPLCLMILCNLGLYTTIIFGTAAQRLFFGDLRPLEVEHLYEKSWFAVTETCLAMTIFRDDFDVRFISLFVVLLLVKMFHWLSQDRVDFMEQTPNLPFFFHLRITALNCPSMMIIFGFEYTILLTMVISTSVKYLLHTIDLRQEAPWEDKSMYIFYLELVIDFFKLVTYCLFFGIVVHFYGLPLHIVRDLYITLRSFVQRIKDLVQYRRATMNMEARYPDASAAELTNADRTCIICREEMNVQQQPVANQQQQQARMAIGGVNVGGPARTVHPDSPKKLPCGHIFHFRCLRSWLERQQSCPTCRRSVLDNAPARPAAQPAQLQAAAPLAQPAHQPNIPQPPPGPIHAPFHPWTPSAWAGPPTTTDPSTTSSAATASGSMPNNGSSTTTPLSPNAADYATTIHTASGAFPVTLTPLLPMGLGVPGSQPTVLDHLSDDQLRQLEGSHREAILARIRAIQEAQRQLTGVVSQLTQIVDLMAVPRTFSSSVSPSTSTGHGSAAASSNSVVLGGSSVDTGRGSQPSSGAGGSENKDKEPPPETGTAETNFQAENPLDTTDPRNQGLISFDVDAENWDSTDFCYPNIFRAWRSNVKDVCSSSDLSPNANKRMSSLRCYEYNINGIMQPLCEGSDLIIDLSKISLPPDKKEYSNPPYLQTEKGAIIARRCNKSDSYDFKKEWMADTFIVSDSDDAEKCDADFGDDVLYLHKRWDTTNVFHIHEDLIMTWIGYHVLKLDKSHTRVIFLDDRRPDGPAVPVWTRAFASREAIGLYDLKQSFGAGVNKLCVKRLVIGVRGGATPFSHTVGGATPCSHHLFQAFSKYIITNLNIKPTWRVRQSPKLKVLMVSRRDYLGRSIRRKIDNERQFVSFLQSELSSDVTVDLVDFSTLPMIDQMQKWTGYDVAIASHGAAQVYSIYSPSWFTMIEIQQPERWSNWHYSNIAKLLGFRFKEFRIGSTSKLSRQDMANIVEAIKETLAYTKEKKSGVRRLGSRSDSKKTLWMAVENGSQPIME